MTMLLLPYKEQMFTVYNLEKIIYSDLSDVILHIMDITDYRRVVGFYTEWSDIW